MRDKEILAMKKKETTGSLMLFVTAMIWGSAFLAQQSGMEHIGPFTMQDPLYAGGTCFASIYCNL